MWTEVEGSMLVGMLVGCPNGGGGRGVPGAGVGCLGHRGTLHTPAHYLMVPRRWSPCLSPFVLYPPFWVPLYGHHMREARGLH